MIPSQLVLIIHEEKVKDLIRKAERQRLVNEAGLRQSINPISYRVIVGWLGDQMVKLGVKLQQYSAASQPENLAIKKA